MIGITHNQFLKLFSDIAIAHRDINSFYSGDLDNYTANQSETLNPVTLWVVIDDDVINGKTDKPKYNFIVLDWVNQDSSNLDEVYSDTLRISKDILALLRQPYYESFFKVQEETTFTPFNEKFDSDVAGWQFSLTFDQPFIYDACEVNTTGLPTINYKTIAINSSTYAWGGITGTLSNQTDLQNALNAKVPTSRILTINGTSYDLSADRSWTISTGGETLAQTLALGNTTSGHNLQLTADDYLYIGANKAIFDSTLYSDRALIIANLNGGNGISIHDSGKIDFSATQYNFSQLTASTVPYLDASKNLVSSSVTPTQLSYLDATSSIQTQLNGKQATLVSGTNIKTINSTTLLGSGDLAVQSVLVSGTNIKTVGGVSLLGSGDIGSISTTYTDAKIKGSIAVNQIAYGSAADTITGSATFLYTGTQLLCGITSAFRDISIGEFYRSSNGTVQIAVYNDNAGSSAYTQFFASNGTSNIAFGVNGTGVTGGALFGTANLAYLGSANAAGTAIYTSNPSGNLYFYVGGNAAANLQQTISPTGVFTHGVAGTSNQYIFNVGSSTALITLRERVGSTTTSAIYMGVASGSESATNYALNWNGTLNINSQTSTSPLALLVGGNSAFIITPSNTTSTAYFSFSTRSRTSLTTTANIPTFEVTSNTQTWAAGTVALQYFTWFKTQTMNFASGSTATFVASQTVEMTTRGANATFGTSVGVYVPTIAYASTTTAASAYLDAPTGATNNYALYSKGSIFMDSGRMLERQGADVASANNLSLGTDGNTFEITGTTQINLISNVGWQNGSKVTLLFTSTPTVKHNQATSSTNITIQLAGAVDFAATAGNTLTLVYSEIGGTNAWREISRAVI